MNTSVIVPTFNRADTLRATLESLIAQDLDRDQYEIVVVDNNSTDHTAAVVRELQAGSRTEIRYLHEPRPGVHFARNLGAMNARGSILYFTDDDMLADRHMLSELLKPFALDPRIAIVTGRVLPKWEREPPDWVVKHCSNAILSLQLRAEDLIVSAEDPGVWSCHEAIRKDVLIECGGFNPENTAGEWVGDGESGLNLKVKERGFRFAFTGLAITHHVIPPERMTQRYLNKRMANQGNSDVFTWFRTERPDNRRLIRNGLGCLWSGAREMGLAASQFLRGNDEWHLHRARVSYFGARIKYNRRLRRDRAWREFVLRENWYE